MCLTRIRVCLCIQLAVFIRQNCCTNQLSLIFLCSGYKEKFGFVSSVVCEYILSNSSKYSSETKNYH